LKLENTTSGKARLAARTLLVAALLGLTACVNPLGTEEARTTPADKASIVLPPAPPRTTALDAASAREHQRLVAAFGGEYRAPQAQTLLNDIIGRLSQATERPSERYQVTILNSPVVNAFALPNGNIYITRGILVLANDTSEIASVLAHEMAHVITRHAVDRQELERTATLVNRVRTDVLQDSAARTMNVQGRVAIASFSRQQELEADALSVRIIARAGFDPYGATRFLDSLGRTTAIRAALLGVNPNAQGMDITATHPAAPERIQLATLAARQIGVRGTTFSHPKLGITFTAPEGFIIENSKEAVVGFSPEGGKAMRFDQVKIDASASLETYVGSGLIEGAAASNVEALSIGGQPAATSVSKSDGWTYRIFAIRSGSMTYRLTYAAREMSPGLDTQFRQSAETFRRLTPQEAAKLKPLRIALVTASAADTAETLSARMASDEPKLERFRVLNGLQVSDRIFAGQRYKLVAD
jgi:predicted Zn-dependent protease